MKAIVLAAGKGTRMGELTEEVPKPMLEVKGRPILESILEGLKWAGIKDIALVTGFKAEVIEAHFGDGSDFGVSLSYARQTHQDGTGKAPEYAKSAVGDSPFILTYGDILVNRETYKRLLEAYAKERIHGVISAKPGAEVAKGGILVEDSDHVLTRVVEKPSAADIERLVDNGEVPAGGPYLYNAGVYIFEPDLFEYTAKLEKSPRGEYELTDAISGLVNAGRRLYIHRIEDDWVDVRDPDVLAEIQ